MSGGKPKGAGRKPAPAGNPQVNLRMPAEMAKAVGKDAAKKKTTNQAVILEIVASYYGVEFTPPKRGKPKTSVDE